MEHTSEPDNCCERFFLAEPIKNEPGVLLLECCTCGRIWRRERDGRLLPLPQATGRHGTPVSCPCVG